MIGTGAKSDLVPSEPSEMADIQSLALLRSAPRKTIPMPGFKERTAIGTMDRRLNWRLERLETLRACPETMLSIELLDRRLRSSAGVLTVGHATDA